MDRRKRLKVWVNTLTNEQKDNIILELTDYAIDSEFVKFYDDSKKPYYDDSGDYIDGTERDE